jgi:hypothetical protein
LTKHTILFLAANPVGTDRLALDEEVRAIRVALERSRHRDQFQLEMRGAVRPLDLLDELRKLKPAVVHFSGHGGSGELRQSAGPCRDIVAAAGAADRSALDGDYQHGLFFQGPDGGPQLVSAAALEETFGAAGASVKLVVLNACYSDVQAEALLTHIDCIVGVVGSIGDSAARNFAIGFYGGLGEGQSVEAAYKQGRAAISLEGLREADRPRLQVREGVDAERLVLVEALASCGASPPAEAVAAQAGPARVTIMVTVDAPLDPVSAGRLAEELRTALAAVVKVFASGERRLLTGALTPAEERTGAALIAAAVRAQQMGAPALALGDRPVPGAELVHIDADGPGEPVRYVFRESASRRTYRIAVVERAGEIECRWS